MKGLKNQLYLYPLSVQKSQDTKLILAPRFIVGFNKGGYPIFFASAKFLEISRIRYNIWNALALFTRPVVPYTINTCWEDFT